MECPKCNNNFKDNMVKFSIDKTGLCPECYGKKCEHDAIEAAKKIYKVEVSTYTRNYEIKATDEDEDEAEEIARERFTDDINEFEVYVREA